MQDHEGSLFMQKKVKTLKYVVCFASFLYSPTYHLNTSLSVCKLWSYQINQDEIRTEKPETLKQMGFNAGDFCLFVCTDYG